LFQSEQKIPRRIGKDLRGELREVEPHRRDNKFLSRGDNKMISQEDTLMQIHFLVTEVEEKAEEELSPASHVVKMVTKPWTIQRERWTEEKLTSLRRNRSMMLRERMQTVEDRLGCIRYF
jgi:hypothetical protein